MLYTEESFNERGYIVTYDNKYRRTKEAEEYEK